MKPIWTKAIIGAAVSLLFGAGIAVAPIAVAVPFPQSCGHWPEGPCNPGIQTAPPGPQQYCKRVGNSTHCGPDVLPGCLETGGRQPCDPDPSAP
jgi:hypothetical protein